MAKLTTEEFIKKAREVHGDKYDYSKVEYVKSSTKVCIICKQHGVFLQSPKQHLSGQGCPICDNKTNLNGHIKWTKEKCYIEAKKYRTRSEFQKANGSAYQSSLKNSWLEDYTWFINKKKPNGYYDYQICLEIAGKCTCLAEMEKENVTAYSVAKKRGWTKDYTWFISTHEAKSRSMTKWTKEKCFEEALKYKSRGELKRECPAVYKKARELGWLKDYTWFSVLWEKKWNYETCLTESRKYSSRGEFSEKSPGAWAVSKKNGWIEEYKWLLPRKLSNGYWTKEACFELAKKCSCVSEMIRISGSAYNTARKNGWIKDYSWFEMPLLTSLDKESRTYSIYVYEDSDNKVCYVGLSKNWKKRHYAHKRIIKGKSDSVKKYFDGIGVEIPLPIILEEGLNPEESQLMEDFWKNEYIRNGWHTLNRGVTGQNKSSLGGGFIKWDYNSCYREAMNYKTIADFQRANPSAQRAARENGWQKSFFWFEKPSAPNKIWDYNTCKEEAKKYSSRSEFSKKSPAAWRNAKKNGWIEEYFWLIPKKHFDGFWTKESCYTEARKYSYLKEFRMNSAVAYGVACKNGWLKEYTWFEKNIHLWTYEMCKTEARKYRKKSHFKVGAPGAYDKSRKKGWLNDFFPNK